MELRSEERLLQKGRVQGTLGFRSTKKLLQLQQKGQPSDRKTRQLFAQTKQKPQETWPPVHGNKRISKDLREKLPEKLLLLEELYHSMEAAISLLRIRHDICTFSTIAAAVESSTHRRFLRSHLAQIRYILPEALQVGEYVSWDAESQCSRRDLRITLHPILKEGTASLRGYKSPQKSSDMVVRRQEFHRRLLEFYRKNEEIDRDVPQAPMFGEVVASCHGGCSEEWSEPSPTHVKDSQKVEKVFTLHGADAILPNECDEPPDVDECDNTPLPIGFDLNQLKKYPRSPSKLPRQQRVLPAPLHSSMSHLPPVFKPHFSAKRQQASLAESDRRGALEKDVSFSSCMGVQPQFSLKKCKKVVAYPVPATPQKDLLQATTPKKRFSDCDTESPPSHTATMRNTALMSPPADLNSRNSSSTPAQNECAGLSTRFSSPVLRTPACTPQQAILTPSASATPSVVVTEKEVEGVPMKRRKQAVIKSLRFGTPTKNAVHDKATEEATPLAVSNAFLSPIKTPATDLSSVSKKPSGNVSRVLPFSSPIGKNKEGPGILSQEEEIHTPKRTKRSCQQLFELGPSSTINESSGTKNSEIALPARESHAANFVDLTSISGADKLSASDMEILKCLPQELLNDVQAKEREHLEDEQLGVEKTRRRLQAIAGLPKLFNMVRLIFQSGNRTVLTRKDLTKMVLSSHPDITDQGEIMERLQLLVELAPEWISVNRSSTGDSLYRINKNANMRAVSKALVEAK